MTEPDEAENPVEKIIRHIEAWDSIPYVVRSPNTIHLTTPSHLATIYL